MRLFHREAPVALVPLANGHIAVSGTGLVLTPLGLDARHAAPDDDAADAFIVGDARVCVYAAPMDYGVAAFWDVPGKRPVPLNVVATDMRPIGVVGAIRLFGGGQIYVAVHGNVYVNDDRDPTRSNEQRSVIVLNAKNGEVVKTVRYPSPRSSDDTSPIFPSLSSGDTRFAATWADGRSSIVWVDANYGYVTVIEYAPSGRRDREYGTEILRDVLKDRLDDVVDRGGGFAHIRASLSRGGRYLLLQDDKGPRPAKDANRTVFYIADLHYYGNNTVVFHPPDFPAEDAAHTRVSGRMTEEGVLIVLLDLRRPGEAKGDVRLLAIDAAAAVDAFPKDAVLRTVPSTRRRQNAIGLDEQEWFELQIARGGQGERVTARSIPYERWGDVL